MRTEYYITLNKNPQIQLRWLLPLIKRAVETGEGITTKEPLPLKGLGYTLYFSPEVRINSDGELTLSLKWEDGGETYRQKIPIIREESNLVSGTFVYFFLCPFGYKSKKLFYVGGGFRSRRSFRHRYRAQLKSRWGRESDYFCEEPPNRRYGKEYYRGKLTPYGKRCKRYEERQEKGLKALEKFLGTSSQKLSKKPKK